MNNNDLMNPPCERLSATTFFGRNIKVGSKVFTSLGEAEVTSITVNVKLSKNNHNETYPAVAIRSNGGGFCQKLEDIT